MLTRSGQSATITFTAETQPEPSFKIFLNETILVVSNKTYTIPEVNSSHVGFYKCSAKNILGNLSLMDAIYLSLTGKTNISPPSSHVHIIFCKDNFFIDSTVFWYK